MGVCALEIFNAHTHTHTHTRNKPSFIHRRERQKESH